MANRAAAPTYESTRPIDARTEWASLHAGFVLIGISMTMLGPVLPYFTHRWSLTDSQAGLFFSALYFGSLLGTLLTSSLLPRFGFSKIISAGYFCFALGFALLGFGPWYLTAMFVAVYGIGLWTRQPFHQYSRHEFALYQCGRSGEPAEFFLGHRRW